MMAAADEVCESWEDMDEIGLDRRLSSFISSVPREYAPPPHSGTVKVVMDSAGTLDAQVMAHHQPAVKILKRPSAQGEGGLQVTNGDNRPRPVKTFQQRQQEYEQARLRILGEAKSPEDVADEMISKLQIKPSITADRVKEKPTIGILTKVNILSNCNSDNAIIAQPKILIAQQPNLVTVLRSPRGPDGTRGFLLRR